VTLQSPCAPRALFLASIEVTELDSEKHLSAHTKNLNLLGCFVETPTPLLEGANFSFNQTMAGRATTVATSFRPQAYRGDAR